MSLELKEEQIIPKLILSRNTTDWSKYEVRESVVGNLGAGTKRRRSTENDHNDVDNSGKRPKTTQPSSAVNDSVLMVPSIPIKLDRRLSGDKNDYRHSTSFKRFSENLEDMLEFDEQCNISSSIDEESQDIDQESLLTRTALCEMCTETAKLNSMHILHKIDEKDLCRLIFIMKRHIKDGRNIQLSFSQNDDEDQRMLKEFNMERILRSFDATLLVLHVLTAPCMPKKVYMEEIIEVMVGLIQHNLKHNIYPAYDPLYKVELDSKESILMSTKAKRAKYANKGKVFVELYNKICTAVSLLADLLDIERLTDTIVLKISSVGTTAFFVENVSELQHCALKLVRTTFRKYLKHRELILEDILASLARLPSSKRNLRSYRIHGDEYIQMLSALVLQLIQCSVKIEKKSSLNDTFSDNETLNMDRELEIIGSYENSLRAAQNFLSMFLNKCNTAGKDEEDYRPLFENFLQDLLVTLNKNDWPASEALLTLLGRLLIVTFTNRSCEMGLRVASIDYLGLVATHLRRKAMLDKEQEQEDLLAIMSEIGGDELRDEEKIRQLDEEDLEMEKTLRKYLLKYFHVKGKNDSALSFARQFYLCQWIRDNQAELERAYKATVPNGSESDLQQTGDGGGGVSALEMKKSFLLSLIDEDWSQLRVPNGFLDYNRANLVAKHLSSKRIFLKSFDIYLQQILRVLNETVVAIRTKAMKALSSIISVDPGILAREDIQNGVQGRFMDQSTSVREAAVELVGRFILNKPELTHQYYDMIMERILDTGVSVRKRVIKILKDICIAQPDFPKITDICMKMICRINDADGIKELVTKVFQQMWFVPVEKSKMHQDDDLLKRATNIADLVTAFGESGGEWLQQLLENLIKNDEESDELSSASKQVLEACSQIVDCLVDRLLTIEKNVVEKSEGKASNSYRLIGCLTTLYMMSRFKPSMMVPHAATLQPYLSTKVNSQGDYLILHYIARILELVLPLIEHPGEAFLASIEEDLMMLIIKQGQTVVQSCVACLAAVVNKVTRNYKLVKDCFQRYFGFLIRVKKEFVQNQSSTGPKFNRPLLLRSLFTLGLLCKHFDFESDAKVENIDSVYRRVYTLHIFYAKIPDEEVSQKAIMGLGFLSIRYPKLLLEEDARGLYGKILSPTCESTQLKNQVMKNITQHLVEEEKVMSVRDSSWKKKANKENLKELGDSYSGTTSEIMQLYLKQLLEMFFHPQPTVRFTAFSVVDMILGRGLVHPVQCVSYLIAIGTNNDKVARTKAAHRLEEIDRKYPGFIQMKALPGVKMSFDLQKIIHKDELFVRGFKEEGTSLLSYLYLIIRSNRQHRRSFLLSLIRMVDDEKKYDLDMLLFVVDSLAYFPFVTLEEPLFIIHNIDARLSYTGMNVMQSFQQALRAHDQSETQNESMETEENADEILVRLPDDLKQIEDCWKSWQKCLLLIYLRQHLKETYNIHDSKCKKYSPSEPSKAYDKGITRKHGVKFNPEQSIACIESGCSMPSSVEVVKQYVQFKKMIMDLDKSEEDSDDSNGRDSPLGESGVDNCQEKKLTKGRKTPSRKTPSNNRSRPKPKSKKKRKKIKFDGDDECNDDFASED
ncbi:nipped-B-like protein isoform X2 [Xenia sp. Carnegie-2017]|uniref:nipped-B-like protein isoform X2 n=1 Tax=Xenia sp. Carnegie-2017 TaxID=2897299 RepID=UPI001F04F2D0|nr:nipped-B-like protein isoform X2 [Xenia sp. Carnegie-2017]